MSSMSSTARRSCPFCHRDVSVGWIRLHGWWHARRRRDGQQRAHVTLAAADRYRGTLVGVPRSYVHSGCGAGTGMPEEIVRSYLANPFLYNDTAFCTGCEDYVPHVECTWLETGQSLRDYFAVLRAAASPELRAQAHVHVHGADARLAGG